MKVISSKSITLIILSALTAALAGLYVFSYLSLGNMGKDQEGIAGAIKDAPSALRREEDNRRRLSAFFIEDGKQAAFVSSVESLCLTLSIRCEPGSITETADESGTTKILSMGIRAEGSLVNINKLIKSFESSPLPIVFGRVALEGDKEGWRALIDVSVPVLINNES